MITTGGDMNAAALQLYALWMLLAVAAAGATLAWWLM
jgi:hypothetical protein